MDDAVLYVLFNQCNERNKFIFEVCSMFGTELTVEELEYWMVFEIIKACNVANLDIKELTFEEATEKLISHNRERRRKLYEAQRKLSTNR